MTTSHQILVGDCLELLRAIPDNSVDSVVTDPPYGLGFMGKKWDASVPGVEVWAECLRVLKPGGHLLAFAGTRTQHRMAVAIEDAGFEIRDMIAWVYGSGFPKSHNLRGEHEGWGTALKPALEPITVARKALAGTVLANVQQHGTGAINIDASRIGPAAELRGGAGRIPCRHDERSPRSGEPSADRTYGDQGATNFQAKPGPRGGAPAGRWPANLIHDGSPEVIAAFPDAPGQQGDLQGHSRDRVSKGVYGDMGAARDAQARGDSGSAARFFYCAKASSREREEGCEGLPTAPGGMASNTSGHHITQRDDDYTRPQRANTHPTVKPTDLMAYLVRLVTPAGGLVLDPFMGSGSTGKACMREGFNFIGCEIDEQYAAIAKARIEHELLRAITTPTSDQLDLFGT